MCLHNTYLFSNLFHTKILNQMFSELLQKLESEHGIDPAKGHGILNTIAEHIKEKFPMVGGMLDNVLGEHNSSSSISGNRSSNTASNVNSMEELQNMSNNKPGGLIGGDIL